MLKNTGITIALAMLSMVGALGIDAYLPSFPAIIQDFQSTPLAVQQTLSIYMRRQIGRASCRERV